MSEPTFNTIYYKAVHGDEPAANKKGTYSFVPPRHCGRKPWEFVDMSYAKAKKEAIKAMGERGQHGEFVLIP